MNKQIIDTVSFGYGMSYSLIDEPKIIKMLPNQTMEQNSVYADMVAKTNAKNINFLESQLPENSENMKITNIMLNPTSIGNAAYVAIYSPEPYASRAKIIYDNIIKNLNNNINKNSFCNII